jgi:hypothetical protein
MATNYIKATSSAIPVMMVRSIIENPDRIDEGIFDIDHRPDNDVLNCCLCCSFEDIMDESRCSNPLSCIHHIDGECDGTPCELCNQ